MKNVQAKEADTTPYERNIQHFKIKTYGWIRIDTTAF